MTDIVCTACRTPKPPCCFDYANRHGDICQPCHAIATHNRRWQRDHTERGRAARRDRTNRMLEQHPERYADGIATLIERKGA